MAEPYRSRSLPSGPLGPMIEECEAQALVTLRGNTRLPGFCAVLGSDLPDRPNRFVEAHGRLIAWLGPDEWLVIGSPGEEVWLCADLHAALEGTHHAVTDVSGGRVLFRLSGPLAYDALSAASSFDSHPRAFGPGDCVQTSFGRTGALILMRDNRPTFELLVRRSYAAYVREWLRSLVSAGVESAEKVGIR